MSIFASLGAVPVKLTVPLMLAAVAGSIGVAAGAGAGAVLGVADDSSLGFLLHPVNTTRPTLAIAHRPRRLTRSLRFMISLHLSWNWDGVAVAALSGTAKQAAEKLVPA